MQFQWWRIGAELYLANRLRANEISDLVHLTKYNKEPISLRYGTPGSNTSSSSSFGWN